MTNKYIIDTCSLINASKNYPMNKKTFEHIWNRFNSLIEDGYLVSIEEVKDEIKDDDLLQWAKTHKKFFRPLNKNTQQKAREILREFPSLIQIKSTSNSNADPFIISNAIELEAAVITEESGKGRENIPNIPNICKRYNIKCINLLSFLDEILE